MSRKTQHINVHCFNINGNVRHRLNRVRVEYDAMLFANFTDFRNRLNRTYFVIGKHNADHYRVGTNSLFNLFRRNEALAVNRQIRYFKALFFKAFHTVKNRMVFNVCGYKVFAFFCIFVRNAFYCPVIGLRTACGKIYFARLGAESGRNLFSCRVEQFLCFSARFMNA